MTGTAADIACADFREFCQSRGLDPRQLDSLRAFFTDPACRLAPASAPIEEFPKWERAGL